MRKPKMPTEVFSILGPVPVGLVPVIEYNECQLGRAHFFDRTIQLKSGVHDTVLWQTLGHELMHFVLVDGGVDCLSHRKCEAVCDAFGTWFAAAVNAGAVSFPTNLSPLPPKG